MKKIMCHCERLARRNLFSNYACKIASSALPPRNDTEPAARRNDTEFAARSGVQGFTLMELLVVIVIIGILAGFVAPRFFDQPGKARQVQAKQQIAAISAALEMYNLDNRTYPTTEQGLEALVEKPASSPEPENWKKGGYMKTIPEDPWSNDYVYLSPGVHGEYDLMSYGADGKKGGADENADITSWEE